MQNNKFEDQYLAGLHKQDLEETRMKTRRLQVQIMHCQIPTISPQGRARRPRQSSRETRHRSKRDTGADKAMLTVSNGS